MEGACGRRRVRTAGVRPGRGAASAALPQAAAGPTWNRVASAPSTESTPSFTFCGAGSTGRQREVCRWYVRQMRVAAGWRLGNLRACGMSIEGRSRLVMQLRRRKSKWVGDQWRITLSHLCQRPHVAIGAVIDDRDLDHAARLLGCSGRRGGRRGGRLGSGSRCRLGSGLCSSRSRQTATSAFAHECKNAWIGVQLFMYGPAHSCQPGAHLIPVPECPQQALQFNRLLALSNAIWSVG